jgi:hypothetical protein
VCSALLLVVWVGYFTALQWSVVRYRLGIVVVVTSAAVLLGTAVGRRWRPPGFPPWQLASALVLCAVVTEVVPFFSYTSSEERRALAHVMAAGCLLAGVSLVALAARRRPGPGRAVAASVAVLAFVAVSAAAIVLDPAPRIDVWVTLQQASDGLADGRNMYTMTWQGSPGIQDAFTYLPWTAVLAAPGRWLTGDVRWALLALALAALACMAALARPVSAARPRRHRGSTPTALAAVTLLAVAPGTITQAEQAWTEPMLLACIAAWALLVRRGHGWWAIVPLAVGCASKQHLAVLLPVLACWRAFGLRRVLATGALAGALVLPWFLANPSAMWHDTVGLLVGFHPIRFANTLFLAARHELGWTPPFWLTGLVVVALLLTACAVVRRRQPDLTELLGWLALVLLVATLVNKQGFYNQYWLVGGLVALALAADTSEHRERGSRSDRVASRDVERLTGEDAVEA